MLRNGEIMSKNITVVGAGSTGLATAAYLTLRGHRVLLCETAENGGDLESIRARNGILLRGNAGITGLAMPDRLATDFTEATAYSDLILICVSASRHAAIARECRAALRPGLSFLLSPGNLGSHLFRTSFNDHPDAAKVLVGELADNLWACRVTGDAEVVAAMPLKPKTVAGNPSSDGAALCERFAGILELKTGRNIVETTLNSPNVVTHVAGSLLNAVQIEKSGDSFAFFRDGLSPSVIACLKAVEEERKQVLEAAGLKVLIDAVGLCEKLHVEKESPGFEIFRGLDGPCRLSHRYIDEDGECGIALLVSLADLLGVPVPVSRGFAEIAGVINSRDYLRNGRTLEWLGLGGLSWEDAARRLA